MEPHPISDNDSRLLKKWNWGACMLGPIWAFPNKLDWWAVLGFVPGVNIVVAIYLGLQGNRIAFRKSDIKSVREFMILQDVWGKWGLWVFRFYLLFAGIALTLFFSR